MQKFVKSTLTLLLPALFVCLAHAGSALAADSASLSDEQIEDIVRRSYGLPTVS